MFDQSLWAVLAVVGFGGISTLVGVIAWDLHRQKRLQFHRSHRKGWFSKRRHKR